MDTIERHKLEEKMASYDGVDRLYSASEAQEYFKQFTYPPAIKSDIYALDKLLGGFEQEEVVVISGRSHSGKTELAVSLTYSFCLQEKNVLWFPYEKGNRHFLSRFEKDGVPGNNFYMPINMASGDTSWIEEKIVECRSKYGLDVVMIDHLHYIVRLTPGVNMSLAIGEKMRDLVRLSQEYKFTLFLIAHIKTIADDKRPTKDDIRDSSFVVQESDTILMVDRILEIHSDYDPRTPNQAKIYVEKNRKYGMLGSVLVEKKGGRLHEVSSETSI